MKKLTKSLIILVVIAAFSPNDIAQDNRTPTTVEQVTDAIRRNDFKSAREIARTAVRTFPRNIDLWNLLGIAETELQNSAAAIDAFDHGLRLAPNSVSLNENMGFLFFRQADYPRARRFLQRAIELGSNNAGVRFSLAASQLRTDDSAAALKAFLSLESQLSDTTAYWEERGRAELPANPAAAQVSFSRALKLDPKSSSAWNGLATIYERARDDEKALATLIDARAELPDDVPTLTHFGAVCIRRDLGPDAIDALARAHRLAPSNDVAVYLLARANISIQNWEAALRLFQDFSTRHPRFAAVWYAMGWLQIRMNHVAEARQLIQHSLALDPSQSDARVEMAQLDFADGHVDNAEAQLTAVLKQNPAHAGANLAMGDILLHQGLLDRAQACYETASHASPALAAPHYKLSIVLTRLHDLKAAEKERDIATRLNAEAAAGSKTQLRLVLPDSPLSNTLP